MDDFSQTPSFYNTQQVFKKYLGQTSYYLGLQEKILKIIKSIKPKQILELGFGTGQTAITVAKHNKNAFLTAVDMRKEMADVALSLAKESKVTNVNFITDDMNNFVGKNLNNFDIIYFLYAFHHIEDPLSIKITFLKNCYKNMKVGGYLLISETFIPEEYSMDGTDLRLLKFFEIRGEEGYASTFWKSLKSLKSKDIAYAKEVANYCRQMEIDAGKLVAVRNNEYLVKRSWLKENVEKIGFVTVLDNPINNIGDAVILFRKV